MIKKTEDKLMMELFSLEELSSRSAYKQDYGLESSNTIYEIEIIHLTGALMEHFCEGIALLKKLIQMRSVNKSLFLPAKYKKQFMA